MKYWWGKDCGKMAASYKSTLLVGGVPEKITKEPDNEFGVFCGLKISEK